MVYPSLLLSESEAAEVLSVSKSTLQKSRSVGSTAISKGKVPPYSVVGKKVLYKRSKVECYVASFYPSLKPELVNEKEAARLLRISVSLLQKSRSNRSRYAHISEARELPPFFKKQGRVWYRFEDLERFVETLPDIVGKPDQPLWIVNPPSVTAHIEASVGQLDWRDRISW